MQVSPGLLRKPGRAECRTATRYGVAVDVNRAADLYALGWTLRQIAAELNLTQSTVSEKLRRAGVTMRRGGPPVHPASTQQIVELRDPGLTWPEIAEQIDMTVSGAWSRYRRATRRGPRTADHRRHTDSGRHRCEELLGTGAGSGGPALLAEPCSTDQLPSDDANEYHAADHL